MGNIKDKIKQLKEDVNFAEITLSNLRAKLIGLESNIQSHVYESLEQAENFLFNMFKNQAHEDCEGAHNCGCDEYVQDFIVDGKEYTAKMVFEYGRHDKTYYYIDSSSFSYKEKE